MTLKFETRPAVLAALEPFCYLSADRPDDHIAVTLWGNGEGFDVEICDACGVRSIGFTHGQFHAMKKLLKALREESTREHH